MRPQPFVPIITLALLACRPMATAALQPASAQPAAQKQESVTTKPVRETLDVSFQGGPVASYIEALRKAAGTIPVNVSLSSDAGGVIVPAINLQSVTVTTALLMLEKLTEDRPEKINVSDSTAGGAPAFSVTVRKPKESERSREIQQRLVISLTDLINARGDGEEQKDKQLETVLSAVEAALRLGRDPNVKMPSISVHRESGLLLMMGLTEDRRTTLEVLDQIRDSLRMDDGPRRVATIQLTNIEAPEIANAIRDVYPDLRSGRSKLIIEDAGPKGLKITGPANIVTGAEGIAAYVDRVRGDPEQVTRVREEMAIQHDHMSALMQSAQQEQARAMDRAAKLQAELLSQQQQLVEQRTRAEMLAHEVEDLRKRLADSQPAPKR